MSDYVYPETRWYDFAEDCPKRAAFIDRLLGRKASIVAPVAPEIELRRCKLKACGRVIQEVTDSKKARHTDVQFCSRHCAKKHAYAMKAQVQTKKLNLQRRLSRPDLLAEAMAQPADAELSAEHRHVLAGVFVEGLAEAVGAR